MDAAVVDLGQVRGLALVRAQGRRIRHVAGDVFFVPSASGSGGYVVDAVKATCTCPAHEDTGLFCKHLWALRYHRRELATPDAESDLPSNVPAKRLTYSQNWPAYNRAQCEEKECVQALLRELCAGIDEPEQKRGRPRIPLRDVIFCAAMKVYGTMSGRRSTTDLRACEASGAVERAPAYNSIFRYVERPDLGPVLEALICVSAKPLRAAETSFAIDATGFSTQTYSRWFDHRYGGEKRTQKWVKAHAMVGTLTNIIVSVEVTDGHVHDARKFLPVLYRGVSSGFQVTELSADKAYLSHVNLATVEAFGGKPFIPLKSNSTSTGSAAWQRLWHHYEANKEDFLAHYHKRSNVESTFSALKRKFGGSVRSKTQVAQFNEVLLKCLCHNLSVIGQSIHELGIDPKFWHVKQ